MNNEEYVARLGFLYQHILNLRNDEDYVINQPQMDKLVEVLSFFIEEGEKQNGTVEPVRLVPREEHSGVTATFLIFDLCGNTIQRFADVIRYTSAVCIDSLSDGKGICISCTVPNVFVHKDSKSE